MSRIAFILSCLLFFGCQPNRSKESLSIAEVAPADQAVANSTEEKSATLSTEANLSTFQNSKTKLIRTADYRFKVDNVNKATAGIETAIQKYPGYLSGSRLIMQNGLIENTMTIRVQAEYFDTLLKEIDKFSIQTDHREVTTSDVGKEYVDLESRLKTKREVESRYMNILRKKTGTIEEILSAERQIGQIHEEIEAAVSRMNYLNEQVRYSTISLAFYEPVAENIAQEKPVIKKFAAAFVAGFSGMVEFLIAVTYLWPLIALSAAAYIIYRIRKRKVSVI